jgi:hypothetical protein
MEDESIPVVFEDGGQVLVPRHLLSLVPMLYRCWEEGTGSVMRFVSTTSLIPLSRTLFQWLVDYMHYYQMWHHAAAATATAIPMPSHLYRRDTTETTARDLLIVVHHMNYCDCSLTMIKPFLGALMQQLNKHAAEPYDTLLRLFGVTNEQLRQAPPLLPDVKRPPHVVWQQLYPSVPYRLYSVLLGTDLFKLYCPRVTKQWGHHGTRCFLCVGNKVWVWHNGGIYSHWQEYHLRDNGEMVLYPMMQRLCDPAIDGSPIVMLANEYPNMTYALTEDNALYRAQQKKQQICEAWHRVTLDPVSQIVTNPEDTLADDMEEDQYDSQAVIFNTRDNCYYHPLLGGPEDSELGQRFILPDANDPVVTVAPMKSTSIVVTRSGAAYCCSTSSHKFGLPEKEIQRDGWVRLPVKDCVDKVACSFMHTLLLCADGKLLVCGYNGQGQLGLPQNVTQITGFTVVPIPSVRIVAVACGAKHSALLSGAGRLYVTGSNNRGQLGLQWHYSKRRLFEFNEVASKPLWGCVFAVQCGRYNTVVATDCGLFVAGISVKGLFAKLGYRNPQMSGFRRIAMLGYEHLFMQQPSVTTTATTTETKRKRDGEEEETSEAKRCKTTTGKVLGE